MTTDAVIATRDIVVASEAVALGLNQAGIAAVTFSDIMQASDAEIMARFRTKPAIAFPVPGRPAEAGLNRLRRLMVRLHVIREMFDAGRERLP